MSEQEEKVQIRFSNIFKDKDENNVEVRPFTPLETELIEKYFEEGGTVKEYSNEGVCQSERNYL